MKTVLIILKPSILSGNWKPVCWSWNPIYYQGNENRFDDLETCKLICAKREHIEPLQISLRYKIFFFKCSLTLYLNTFIKKRNWVFAANSDFLIHMSLQHNVVYIRYFKLWIVLCSNNLSLKYQMLTPFRRNKDKNIWVCGEDQWLLN